MDKNGNSKPQSPSNTENTKGCEFKGNEKLKEERFKAIETLKKSIKENASKPCVSSSHLPTLSELSFDFASYRWKDSLDISSFDRTIDVNSFSQKPNPSFEPTEITGRSTSYENTKSISVDQILATSCSKDVRDLRQSLHGRENLSSSVTGLLSKFDKLNLSSSNRDSLQSLNSIQTKFSNDCQTDQSGIIVDENFLPGEKYLSKILADEKEWEQEYADIPGNKNSNNYTTAEQKDIEKSTNSKTLTDFPKLSDSSDMSMGRFFQMRSADLQSIISSDSPRMHKPVALINESDLERDTSKNEEDEQIKEYSLLSLSAIADALNELDSRNSTTLILNRLLGFKSINIDQPQERLKKLSLNTTNRTYSLQPKEAIRLSGKGAFVNNDNKENVDPKSKPIELCDTASFTDSLLDISSIHEQPHTLNEVETPISIQNNFDTPKFVLEESNASNKKTPNNSRKRSHSALKSPQNSNVKIDFFGNFKESTLELNNQKSPGKFSQNSSGSSTPKTQIQNNLEQRKYLHVNCTDSFDSIQCSRDISKITNKSPSPISSLESTVNDDVQRCTSVRSISPDYGKFSLPNSALHIRAPSTSNLSAKSGSSSLYSHRDGKLPLKTTSVHLSWGSVKLRKTIQKSVQIKNTSNKRVVVRVEISGPGFQLINSSEQGNLMTFHSQECRTMILSFCPTVIGLAIGKIRFCPTKEGVFEDQIIFLYGYGGHASINLQGILRPPVGLPFIEMGEFKQLSRTLTKTFSISNKGTLTGFAIIKVDSIGLDIPRLCDSIEVSPSKVLIHPQSVINVTVTLKLRRDEIKKIMKKLRNVLTLANIRIICGDEPTRFRIKKLVNKMSGKDKSKMNIGMLEDVWQTTSDETATTYNLNDLKETSDVIAELMETMKTYEIALTLTHTQSLDETIETTLIDSDNDETIMFRTIISNVSEKSMNSDCELMNPIKNIEQNASTSKNNICLEMWSVKPNVLEINPINKKVAILTVSNKFSKPHDFQVTSNSEQLFEIHPKMGRFLPGEDFNISVAYIPSFAWSFEHVFLEIFIENAKISVPVKIVKDS